MQWNFENTYLQLPDVFYSRHKAFPSPNPQAVIVNDRLIRSLGLGSYSEADCAVLAGNSVVPGSVPFAQAYSGHQYGHFTHLGDGRALILGEHVTPNGQRWDVQLKGSGRTPYSRRGDGKAALGPMLREYLISEAMHALGIPTTRSLAVIATGEPVIRETILPGAILVRVAASHIRVGTFEFAASCDSGKLKALADYTIARHYPELIATPEPYVGLIRTVARRQAQLVAQWLRVGFVHGVMNTDNMAVSGETIDYGPCAFMNTYDPATVFSSIDQYGRYAYGQQASIALWNLERFAQAILPLVDTEINVAREKAAGALQEFISEFQQAWITEVGRKLGIAQAMESDAPLLTEFLKVMQMHKADFTNTFWELSSSCPPKGELFQTAEFRVWEQQWKQRLATQSEPVELTRERMRASNPAIIARNHRVEAALSAASAGDLSLFHRLLQTLSHPYRLEEKDRELQAPPTAEEQQGYQTFCGT